MSTLAETFGRVDQICVGLLPGLKSIDWRSYGSRLTSIDPITGAMLHQAFILMVSPVSGWKCFKEYGELHQPESHGRAVTAEIAFIFKDQRKIASIAHRSPPSIQGGAIKHYDDSCWGISGIPPLAGHILVTHLLSHVHHGQGSLTNRFLTFSFPGIEAAANEAGTNERQYLRLVNVLDDIVSAAAVNEE